jgi:hypothetical protein
MLSGRATLAAACPITLFRRRPIREVLFPDASGAIRNLLNASENEFWNWVLNDALAGNGPCLNA